MSLESIADFAITQVASNTTGKALARSSVANVQSPFSIRIRLDNVGDYVY
jgi:hypothetical protein